LYTNLKAVPLKSTTVQNYFDYIKACALLVLKLEKFSGVRGQRQKGTENQQFKERSTATT
jgi:hypothetical protein